LFDFVEISHSSHPQHDTVPPRGLGDLRGIEISHSSRPYHDTLPPCGLGDLRGIEISRSSRPHHDTVPRRGLGDLRGKAHGLEWCAASPLLALTAAHSAALSKSIT